MKNIHNYAEKEINRKRKNKKEREKNVVKNKPKRKEIYGQLI